MEAVPIAVGAVLAALIAPGAMRAFAEAGWTRENYRGAALPFPAGVIAVVASILSIGLLGIIDGLAGTALLAGISEGLAWGEQPRDALGTLEVHAEVDARAALGAHPVALAALLVGVAFLGLLDDLFEGAPRGWRGHFGAVLRGQWSTGVLKAVGTPALVIALLAGDPLPLGEVALAVVVISLATNLFNLLDLRPGRSAKGFVLLTAGLLIATQDTLPLQAVGVFAGPLVVLGVYDLRERAMLGDTGSNLLGAIAGVWLVLALDTTGQAVAAGVLLALTIYGEIGSFTATIDRIGPLRWLDRLGRPSRGLPSPE
jgi:UDP-GlcNAc:undecaprenyl-phosphate GlcNAc-1-phosphate transferase